MRIPVKEATALNLTKETRVQMDFEVLDDGQRHAEAWAVSA